MNLEFLSDWLAMGGHGRYVWGAVLAVLLALGIESALLTRRRRRALRDAVDALDAEAGA